MDRKIFEDVISLFVIVIVITLSIGFSAFDNNLTIDSISANVSPDALIKITSFGIYETSTFASCNNTLYDMDSVNCDMVLPNDDSYVVLDVEIKNFGNVEMGIFDIILSDDRYDYEVLNYDLGNMLCDDDVCKNGIVNNIYVKVKYKDGNIVYDDSNVKLDFIFEGFHDITYSGLNNSEDYPKKIINNGCLRILLDSDDVSKVNVRDNSRVLVKDVDYSISSDNYLIIENVDSDLFLYTELSFIDDALPEVGSISNQNLTLTYYGNGEYSLDGYTSMANTYIRLSYDMKIDYSSAANLVDGNTVVDDGYDYRFDVDIIGGSYSGITGANQMKLIFRGINSAFALTDFGYDFWSGYYGRREGTLLSGIGMVSCWIKASSSNPVYFNNYRFKVSLVDNSFDDSVINSPPLSSITTGGVTVDYHGNGVYVLNGTSINSNNFLKVAGIDSELAFEMKNLYSGGNIIFTSGSNVYVNYKFLKNVPSLGTSDFTMNFRDNTSSVSAINDVKFTVSGKNGVKLDLADKNALVTGTLSKNASMLSIYFSSGVVFDDFCFYIDYGYV